MAFNAMLYSFYYSFTPKICGFCISQNKNRSIKRKKEEEEEEDKKSHIDIELFCLMKNKRKVKANVEDGKRMRVNALTEIHVEH